MSIERVLIGRRRHRRCRRRRRRKSIVATLIESSSTWLVSTSPKAKELTRGPLYKLCSATLNWPR